MTSRKFILNNLSKNNNKFWNIKNIGSVVEVYYGRIGYQGQNDKFEFRDESWALKYIEKRVREKLKKGYSEIFSSENTLNLGEIAKSQIERPKEVDSIIDLLVKTNVHNILGQTSLTYDDFSGNFSTPCGLVTLSTIESARELLRSLTIKFSDEIVSKYLNLIPKNIGMRKKSALEIFPNLESIVQEFDLLNSLESSLSLNTSKNAPTVFELSLDLLKDDIEFKRISDKIKLSSKNNHQSSNYKLKQIYKISYRKEESLFHKKKSDLGNVKELFHGCSVSNVLSILAKGLSVPNSFKQIKNGSMFGVGIYGSDIATKALNYSTGFWSGESVTISFMFLADFVMGKEFESPYKQNFYPVSGYDSTYIKGGTCGVLNNEMVVYDNSQVSLKYLLHFEKG